MNDLRFRTVVLSVCLLGLMTTAQAQWQPTSIPSSVHTYSIITASNSVFVGTDIAVFYSSNGGENWSHPANLGIDTAGAVYTLAMNDSFLFGGTNLQGVFRSADLGASWEAVSTGLPSAAVSSLVVSDSGIFVGMYPGVYLSTNNGLTWLSRRSGMYNHNVRELVIAHDGSGKEILFAGGTGVFRSTNHGVNWIRVDAGWVDNSIWALAVGSDSNIYAGTDQAGVYYSSNMGSSWERRGLTNQSVQGIAVVPDSLAGVEKLLAGTFASGIFGSFDTGKSWFALNFGMTGLDVNALAVNTTHAFAGRYHGGVLRQLLHDILDPVEDETGALPAQFTLEQNYPNPFNPTTTIAFLLTARSAVTLVISDIDGREVARLLDRRLMGAGRHDVPFDGSGLASGMYMYRLEIHNSGGGLDRMVRKMVLLK